MTAIKKGRNPSFLKHFPVNLVGWLSEELQNHVYKNSLIKDKCYTLVEKIDTDTVHNTYTMS